MTIRVNYFGTLNVCKALLPIINPHGRLVVFVHAIALCMRDLVLQSCQSWIFCWEAEHSSATSSEKVCI